MDWFVFCYILSCITVQPRTPLEEEVAAVLRGSAHVLERSNKELTEEEEKALLAMDLDEVSEYFLLAKCEGDIGWTSSKVFLHLIFTNWSKVFRGKIKGDILPVASVR